MNKKTIEKKPALNPRGSCLDKLKMGFKGTELRLRVGTNLDEAGTRRHEEADARDTLTVFHSNNEIFTATMKWSHLCEHV